MFTVELRFKIANQEVPLSVAPFVYFAKQHFACMQSRSIEGELKRKHFPRCWSFSCFQPDAIKLGVFWPPAPSARLLAVQQFSLSAVFIALRDEASPL
jgi:hypothetical protein